MPYFEVLHNGPWLFIPIGFEGIHFLTGSAIPKSPPCLRHVHTHALLPDCTIPAYAQLSTSNHFVLQQVLRPLVQTCSTNLRVAQLVERETVRVALYLEVACSTQALEISFDGLDLDLSFC